jgi:hypothetical protein
LDDVDNDGSIKEWVGVAEDEARLALEAIFSCGVCWNDVPVMACENRRVILSESLLFYRV